MRLEEIDFQPKTPGPAFLSFVGTFYALFGVAMAFGARDALFGEPDWLDRLGVGLMVVTYVAVLPAFLAFVFWESRRYRFRELGVDALIWCGRRSMEWSDVERAVLEQGDAENEPSFFLRLDDGRPHGLRVPLEAFRLSATLLAHIRARLPVEVGVAPGVDPVGPPDRPRLGR
jgi:hypothetical protein